jgi:hypothetical protein
VWRSRNCCWCGQLLRVQSGGISSSNCRCKLSPARASQSHRWIRLAWHCLQTVPGVYWATLPVSKPGGVRLTHIECQPDCYSSGTVRRVPLRVLQPSCVEPLPSLMWEVPVRDSCGGTPA